MTTNILEGKTIGRITHPESRKLFGLKPIKVGRKAVVTLASALDDWEQRQPLDCATVISDLIAKYGKYNLINALEQCPDEWVGNIGVYGTKYCDMLEYFNPSEILSDTVLTLLHDLASYYERTVGTSDDAELRIIGRINQFGKKNLAYEIENLNYAYVENFGLPTTYNYFNILMLNF